MNKTKDKLVSALQTVLQRKSLDKIKISDITDECGMNRQTFYYHFHDMYDLISYSYYQDTTKPQSLSYSSCDWKCVFQTVLGYLEENKTFVSKIYHSMSAEYLNRFLSQSFNEYLIKSLNDLNETKKVSEKEIKNIARFYTFAIVGEILNWLKEDMKESKEVVIANLSTLMCGNLEDVLERFRNQK